MTCSIMTCEMNNFEIEWSFCSALMQSFVVDWAQSTNFLSLLAVLNQPRSSVCLSVFRNRKTAKHGHRESLIPQHFCQFFQREVIMLISAQWGAADAEIKVPSGENTELKRSPFKAWSRPLYSHTCYTYCQGFLPQSTNELTSLPISTLRSIHLHFLQNLSRFFPDVILCGWLGSKHQLIYVMKNRSGFGNFHIAQLWHLIEKSLPMYDCCDLKYYVLDTISTILFHFKYYSMHGNFVLKNHSVAVQSVS